MYKLITFDANGTLLKVRYPVGQMYSAIAKNFGLESDPLKLENGFKKSWSPMSKKFPNFGASTIGWENWWKMLVTQSFSGSYNEGLVPERDIEPVANELIKVFSSDEGWHLKDGCIETLEKLKTKNVTIGVISNADPRLHNVLKSLNIKNYFDFVITSYEANVMKPDPKIFKLAEESNNNLSNKRDRKFFLHIGDNVEFDYLGALNAGWDSILLNEDANKLKSKHPTIDCEKVYRNLNELSIFLDNRLSDSRDHSDDLV